MNSNLQNFNIAFCKAYAVIKGCKYFYSFSGCLANAFSQLISNSAVHESAFPRFEPNLFPLLAHYAATTKYTSPLNIEVPNYSTQS